MQGALIRHGALDLWRSACRLSSFRALQFFSHVVSGGGQDLWATEVTLNSKEKVLEVEFNTGEKFHFPAELLRVESPAADSQHTPGTPTKPKLVHGRRYVGILSVEPVGRYAVRIGFDDLHGSGLFTWDYLHYLGRNKYRRMRWYINALREQGLSRDPLRSTAKAAAKKSKTAVEENDK